MNDLIWVQIIVTISGMSGPQGRFPAYKYEAGISDGGDLGKERPFLFIPEKASESSLSVGSGQGRARTDGRGGWPWVGRGAQQTGSADAACVWSTCRQGGRLSESSSRAGVLWFGGGFLCFSVARGRGGEERNVSLSLAVLV